MYCKSRHYKITLVLPYSLRQLTPFNRTKKIVGCNVSRNLNMTKQNKQNNKTTHTNYSHSKSQKWSSTYNWEQISHSIGSFRCLESKQFHILSTRWIKQMKVKVSLGLFKPLRFPLHYWEGLWPWKCWK